MRSAGARTLSRMCTPSANVNLNVDGPSSSAKEDHRSEPHLRKFGFLSEKEDLPAWPGPVRPGISRFIPDSFGLHRYPGKHFSNRDSASSNRDTGARIGTALKFLCFGRQTTAFSLFIRRFPVGSSEEGRRRN